MPGSGVATSAIGLGYVKPGAGGAWTPQDIPGITLWWETDDFANEAVYWSGTEVKTLAGRVEGGGGGLVSATSARAFNRADNIFADGTIPALNETERYRDSAMSNVTSPSTEDIIFAVYYHHSLSSASSDYFYGDWVHANNSFNVQVATSRPSVRVGESTARAIGSQPPDMMVSGVTRLLIYHGVSLNAGANREWYCYVSDYPNYANVLTDISNATKLDTLTRAMTGLGNLGRNDNNFNRMGIAAMICGHAAAGQIPLGTDIIANLHTYLSKYFDTA